VVDPLVGVVAGRGLEWWWVAGLGEGGGRAGALGLAGGGGEQFAGVGEVHAEDGEVVTYGECLRLALLGDRAGRLSSRRLRVGAVAGRWLGGPGLAEPQGVGGSAWWWSEG
jgi:hypothetical protein